MRVGTPNPGEDVTARFRKVPAAFYVTYEPGYYVVRRRSNRESVHGAFGPSDFEMAEDLQAWFDSEPFGPPHGGWPAERNPMANYDEMQAAVVKWIEKKEAAHDYRFMTPDEYNVHEGRERGDEFALLPYGFVVLAEGTRFNRTLAMGDGGREEQRFYQDWEKLLKKHGWWWDALTSVAIYVYPDKAQPPWKIPAQNPGARAREKFLLNPLGGRR